MELQLVVFSLAEEAFGVPVDQVREIIRFTEITKIPKAPPSVLGVLNLRGHIIPVISLRERFGFVPLEVDSATRIVVAEVQGQTVGFVVDTVAEVLRMDDSTIEPAPVTDASVNSSFIKGLGKIEDRIIILLDLGKVFDFFALPAQTASKLLGRANRGGASPWWPKRSVNWRSSLGKQPNKSPVSCGRFRARPPGQSIGWMPEPER